MTEPKRTMARQDFSRKEHMLKSAPSDDDVSMDAQPLPMPAARTRTARHHGRCRDQHPTYDVLSATLISRSWAPSVRTLIRASR